jgi:hypothetical protein
MDEIYGVRRNAGRHKWRRQTRQRDITKGDNSATRRVLIAFLCLTRGTARIGYTDRLPAANPTIVHVGANDRSRGTPSATIGANLGTIVGKLRARCSAVMLAQNRRPEISAGC